MLATSLKSSSSSTSSSSENKPNKRSPINWFSEHPFWTGFISFGLLATTLVATLTGFGIIPLGFGLASLFSLPATWALVLNAVVSALSVPTAAAILSGISFGIAELIKLFTHSKTGQRLSHSNQSLHMSDDSHKGDNLAKSNSDRNALIRSSLRSDASDKIRTSPQHSPTLSSSSKGSRGDDESLGVVQTRIAVRNASGSGETHPPVQGLQNSTAQADSNHADSNPPVATLPQLPPSAHYLDSSLAKERAKMPPGTRRAPSKDKLRAKTQAKSSEPKTEAAHHDHNETDNLVATVVRRSPTREMMKLAQDAADGFSRLMQAGDDAVSDAAVRLAEVISTGLSNSDSDDKRKRESGTVQGETDALGLFGETVAISTSEQAQEASVATSTGSHHGTEAPKAKSNSDSPVLVATVETAAAETLSKNAVVEQSRDDLAQALETSPDSDLLLAGADTGELVTAPRIADDGSTRTGPSVDDSDSSVLLGVPSPTKVLPTVDESGIRRRKPVSGTNGGDISTSNTASYVAHRLSTHGPTPVDMHHEESTAMQAGDDRDAKLKRVFTPKPDETPSMFSSFGAFFAGLAEIVAPLPDTNQAKHLGDTDDSQHSATIIPSITGNGAADM